MLVMDEDDVSSCSSTVSSVSEEDEEEEEEEEEGEMNSKSASTPLQNMSSLLQQLPSKRGLSKHYNGKSQSFTSLSQVESLEDLAKPENPYNKRLKTSKSFEVFSRNNTCSSRLIAKRGSQFGNNSSRPPIAPPYRSASTSSFTNQTTFFT